MISHSAALRPRMTPATSATRGPCLPASQQTAPLIVSRALCIITTLPEEIGRCIRTSSGLACRKLRFGLAERGLRQVEGPPLGWIKCGLDSYFDPGSYTLHSA